MKYFRKESKKKLNTISKNFSSYIRLCEKKKNIDKKKVFNNKIIKSVSKYFKKIDEYKLYIYRASYFLEDMFLRTIKVKDHNIINLLFGNSLKIKKLRYCTVTRQTKSGRRMKKKVCIAVGDMKGHIGIGIHSASDGYYAIMSATRRAKISLKVIKRGFWNNSSGEPHTVDYKISGKAGSVIVVIIPAPVGVGIKAAKYQRNVLNIAGITDCYTRSFGHTKSSFNTIIATYNAINSLFKFNTPEMWEFIK